MANISTCTVLCLEKPTKKTFQVYLLTARHREYVPDIILKHDCDLFLLLRNKLEIFETQWAISYV